MSRYIVTFSNKYAFVKAKDMNQAKLLTEAVYKDTWAYIFEYKDTKKLYNFVERHKLRKVPFGSHTK